MRIAEGMATLRVICVRLYSNTRMLLLAVGLLLQQFALRQVRFERVETAVKTPDQQFHVSHNRSSRTSYYTRTDGQYSLLSNAQQSHGPSCHAVSMRGNTRTATHTHTTMFTLICRHTHDTLPDLYADMDFPTSTIRRSLCIHSHNLSSAAACSDSPSIAAALSPSCDAESIVLHTSFP